MEYYFCERYINIDADEKKVEQDMCVVISYFRDSNDHYRYENERNHLENFFSYFSNMSKSVAMPK